MKKVKLADSEEWFDMDSTNLFFKREELICNTEIRRTKKGTLVINDVFKSSDNNGLSCLSMWYEWRKITQGEAEEIVEEYELEEVEEQRSNNELEV